MESRERSLGIFQYDFDIGSRFLKNQALPTRFKTLRTSIGDHFNGTHHARNAAKADWVSLLAQGRFNKNQVASRHVMRTGYFILKQALPHATFEDLVVLQHKNKVAVGDINHSSGFIPSLRTQVSDVMHSKLAGFIAKQPCVSLCVDKVTIARRTVDITAILAVVPGAPLEHIIQPFVIGAPVVQDHTGEGLAKEIASSLAAVGATHPDKLVAICTDGQYLVTSVPPKQTWV